MACRRALVLLQSLRQVVPRQSFHLTTLVTNRMERPNSAAATALMPTDPPKIHKPTVTAKAPAVIFSSSDKGPSFSSSALAVWGASGVSFISAKHQRTIFCTATVQALWQRVQQGLSESKTELPPHSCFHLSIAQSTASCYSNTSCSRTAKCEKPRVSQYKEKLQ